MKKISTFMAAVFVGYGLNAHAFNINTGNSNANQGIKTSSKVAGASIEASINDKIKKENCAFADSKTDNKTTCDLDKIIKYLVDWKKGLESTIANDVDVHIEASADKNDLAWKRVSFVQDKMRAKLSYWDWYTHKTTANADKMKIWVDVKN
ncbi:MAG TPA: hypothetical protein DDW49_10740 [Deltaproteobacteria bacterium]|nr:MAG: hypothetical protein A2048_07060 [Deltaproteobacteria bacterium GWA2_45_12]HBF13840.1 hypothetical protein [Deltaproteobacteria bacterium]